MIRFEIITRDRLGITVEILEKIYNGKINLISMEVFFQKVCVKVEDMEEKLKKELMKEICNIKDIISVKEMELLYYEQKEKKLKAIIDSIEDREFKNIIGISKAIERVKNMTLTIAKSNSTVLLRGESGTGKEVFAKAIHDISPRCNKNFIAINCAALPETLLESELFGYEPGSFTGAMIGGKDGIIKEASGGTLFLDEIGEMPMFIQAKLLRVIQEGKIRKIGSNKEEAIDVRIIAATNNNLEDMIKDKTFREDLYYRLNVVPMYIPTLKERLEDIPLFVQFFIDKLNYKLNKNIKGADVEFISELMKYHWPGNVRELQNVIERAMNLCKGDILTAEDIFINFKNDIYSYGPKEIIDKKSDEYLQLPLKDIMEKCEKEIIKKAIDNYKSYRKAASVLKVSHTTIMNKINKYNIKI
ncbi:MAG: AAA family ATPase [Clostridium sulfidigenes]|uniref:HTH-type transcriptional regulatory protein TyrR n=1 Tax=Clostridium sulfidigenes TaxID=318464 RepID=A0A927W5P8_9CLOT|nr:AAA family ATPase [Clostridium sulfidigenes]